MISTTINKGAANSALAAPAGPVAPASAGILGGSAAGDSLPRSPQLVLLLQVLAGAMGPPTVVLLSLLGLSPGLQVVVGAALTVTFGALSCGSRVALKATQLAAAILLALVALIASRQQLDATFQSLSSRSFDALRVLLVLAALAAAGSLLVSRASAIKRFASTNATPSDDGTVWSSALLMMIYSLVVVSLHEIGFTLFFREFSGTADVRIHVSNLVLTTVNAISAFFFYAGFLKFMRTKVWKPSAIRVASIAIGIMLVWRLAACGHLLGSSSEIVRWGSLAQYAVEHLAFFFICDSIHPKVSSRANPWLFLIVTNLGLAVGYPALVLFLHLASTSMGGTAAGLDLMPVELVVVVAGLALGGLTLASVVQLLAEVGRHTNGKTNGPADAAQ